MSAGDIAQIGGLILAGLGAVGAVIRFILKQQEGGDVADLLRKENAELKTEITNLRNDMEELRRDHKGEIDALQQEVRRLMSDRR